MSNKMALDALKFAEAALADIGDADREPGDDLAWCEARAAEALPQTRAAIAALEAEPPKQEAERDWSTAQDWRGMDGAIAWHLIDRHADGWDDVGAMMNAWLAAQAEPQGWRPISEAPKDGRSMLLGYPNRAGKWRTVRGQWFSDAEIAETWEEEGDEGWYETSVECEDLPNCWPIEPTHWMPLPATPPKD